MRIIRLMGNSEMDEVGLKGGHKLKLREALKVDQASVERCALAMEPPQQSEARVMNPSSAFWPEDVDLYGAPNQSTPCQLAGQMGHKVERAMPSAAPASASAGSSDKVNVVAPGISDDLSASSSHRPLATEAPCAESQGTRDPARKAENLLFRARGQGQPPQQRRYIKDGKITYVND